MYDNAEQNLPVDEYEVDDDFDYSGFQVVRGEFFAHLREPSLTFNDCKVTVNATCLGKMPDVTYVQILVNPETRKLVILPSSESIRDSFQWCTISGNKRKPKSVSCKIFFAKLAALMDWNPEYRYKMIGKLIKANGRYLFSFDLKAAEVYERALTDGNKVRRSRTPVFPKEWQNQFGLPVQQHTKSLDVNIFDGYAVFGVKDTSKAVAADPSLGELEFYSEQGGYV